tara:strand:- start:9338 stop:9631 length:294 start_codon:yes stop_codon:yes gene_type:complete
MNPYLIEDNVKNYLYSSLNKCHDKKVTVYSTVNNITIFILFFILMAIILFLFKKKALTPYELEAKMKKEQMYVVSKIRDYKEIHKSSSMITDLPSTS